MSTGLALVPRPMKAVGRCEHISVRTKKVIESFERQIEVKINDFYAEVVHNYQTLRNIVVHAALPSQQTQPCLILDSSSIAAAQMSLLTSYWMHNAFTEEDTTYKTCSYSPEIFEDLVKDEKFKKSLAYRLLRRLLNEKQSAEIQKERFFKQVLAHVLASEQATHDAFQTGRTLGGQYQFKRSVASKRREPIRFSIAIKKRPPSIKLKAALEAGTHRLKQVPLGVTLTFQTCAP